MTLRVHHIPHALALHDMRGGVKEACEQLILHLSTRDDIELVGSSIFDFDLDKIDVVHVQSSFVSPGRVDVYTCHGGFVPVIPQVLRNLKDAKIIISVAEWLVDKYFPQYRQKTVIIPNGVNLPEWKNLPPSDLEPGYFLWGKHFIRDDWGDFYNLALAFPRERFVTTLVAENVVELPSNMTVIGYQPMEKMRSIINDCKCLVSTGSEVNPIMVLEAMACERSVLARNIDGNKEVLTLDGGRLHPIVVGGALYNDQTEMEAAARHILQAGPILGLQGRLLVEDRYTWPRIVDRIVEVYESIQ